jgi:class 3 adenylate cyclase/acyl-coenzyme A thioesterase PaaI-like protein
VLSGVTTVRAIEPVRGHIPPPWYFALPGIERIEALAHGRVPLPPLCRLLGIRPGHVGPGLGSWTMPASPFLQIYGAELEVGMLAVLALEGAATSTLAPGLRLQLLTADLHAQRPTRAQPGNLVARARVLNANPFFLFAEAQVEDPQGRQILAATGHLAIHPVEPAPPEPPAELAPAEEATYATPDPYLRPIPPAPLSRQQVEGLSGERLLEALIDPAGAPAFAVFMGYEPVELREGFWRGELRASEWSCLFDRSFHPSMLSSLLGATATATAMSLARPGESFSGFTHTSRFLRPVPADGSLLHFEARAAQREGPMVEVVTELVDASGAHLAHGYAFGCFLEAARRRRPRAAPSRRALYTLLFTDVVDSTKHLERLGDARFRELLEEHHRRVREEIARYEGVEVDANGDGFFARFTSPAMALACVRAVQGALRPLGIEIRAGLHTGECEERGARLAGVAVHLGARIQAAAAPGEILVSRTVKELVAGSGLRFADRGDHELKGIEGTWRLYALDEAKIG